MAAPQIDLTIESLGANGDGVATMGQGPVYVPHCLPGERVAVRISKRTSDRSFGELLAVKTPSGDRRPPACKHFGACGGCSLQHLAAEPYLDWKRAKIATALGRRGIRNVTIAPTMSIAPGSRRRITLVARKTDRKGILLGYHRRQSKQIVNLEECPIATDRITDILPPLRTMLADLLSAGGTAQVKLFDSASGIDMVLETSAEIGLPVREAIVQFAEEQDIARISVAHPDDQWVDPIVARRAPMLQFGTASVEPPAGAFLQATLASEQAIVQTVCGKLADAKRVADLFSGCGTLTFPIARQCAVHAVDNDPAALSALRKAADRQQFHKVTNEQRDLFRRPLAAAELKAYDAVTFDPPRAGALAQARELALAKPKKVIAVSCNPATFARDARLLIDGGYRLVDVTPIDQFLWSPHIELAAEFVV